MGIKIKIKKPKIKLPKAVTKVFEPITKPVSSAIKGTGNFAETFGKAALKGDIGGMTDSYADGMGDLFTGGNRKQFNAVSGGSLDSLKGAYRGNSKDIARLGVTGAAAVYGGPAGAAAANSFFAAGGTKNLAAGGAAAFGSYQDPTGTALNMAAGTLIKPKKPRSSSIENFYGSGMEYAGEIVTTVKKNKMIYIGAAAFFAIIAILLIKQKRK